MVSAMISMPDMEKLAVLANNFSMAVLDFPLVLKIKSTYRHIKMVEKYWDEMKERSDFLGQRSGRTGQFSMYEVWMGAPSQAGLFGRRSEKQRMYP
ncbi:unnamed protein product [Acanthoscelides obtectus]|uniref:Uncharacterized protein n=1 Tax=Acanthoscelides obtectus TaxID=200917 RepID=A0A9P0K6B0_ACAOB|nr:unnamed protein product [Acanthoscelides obtectus]CAK1631103.1 hypothetical protein AOBTE_LOCUS6758 [Acanthoscelides obtectus]